MNTLQRRQHIGRLKRQLPRDHSVEHTPQTEKVRAMINDISSGLFRRHKTGSASDHSRLCKFWIVISDSREPEIENLDSVGFRFDPDICRLDVAMDQALFVGGCQAECNLTENVAGHFIRKHRATTQ